MHLMPQDVLVLLKLVAIGQQSWSYSALAVELGMSSSQVHSAVRRVLAANLAMRTTESIRPNIGNLEEFLIHGVKYAFPPESGELTRGIPTGHAAPPFASTYAKSTDPPPVWPDPEGKVRGQTFRPLHKSVPQAAKRDASLYEFLVLVDAIRGGRARERKFAVNELKRRLDAYG